MGALFFACRDTIQSLDRRGIHAQRRRQFGAPSARFGALAIVNLALSFPQDAFVPDFAQSFEPGHEHGAQPFLIVCTRCVMRHRGQFFGGGAEAFGGFAPAFGFGEIAALGGAIRVADGGFGLLCSWLLLRV